MPESVVFVYTAANALMAISMLSIASAIVFAAWRKRPQHPWMVWAFAAFFAVAGLSRVLKTVHRGDIPQGELLVDVLGALIGISTAIIIWPVAVRSLKMPSYTELQDAYHKLDTANEQLRRSRHMFESFMNAIPAIAYLRDSNGTFVYVNPAYERITGRSPDLFVGQATLPWLPEYLAEQGLKADLAVIQSGEKMEQVERYPDARGRQKTYLMIRFPVQDAPGKTLSGCVAIDVTPQLQLEETRARIESIVESSQDAIIGKDLDGLITSWNKGAEELYGYSANEVIGKPISILTPPERRHEVDEIIDKIRRGVRVTDFETTRICKRGELKEVSISASPIRENSGQVIGVSLIVRNIATLKTQQRQIEQLNEELRKRVYELAESNAALEAARDQAMEASNLKSAFVANISHELRTPLSGILGLNELLLESELDPEQRSLAAMVQQSAEALVTVVNDILDLSKIEAGKITLDYEQFNPVGVIQDCGRLMAPTAHNKQLEYSIEIDPVVPELVYGDSTRLRQVMLNLMGNAIKFTESGSISVIVRALQLSDDQALLEFGVRDTGIGIAPDQQRFLFRPFSQIDSSSTRKFGGTGLGLIISKQFVEMMGGEIGVESEKGRGSLFWIRVPFDRKRIHEAQQFSTEKMARPGVEPVPPELAAGRAILVVEDNQVLQNLALRQLSSLGLKAQATVFGREAIGLAMSGKFHLVLMDVNLPDITGLEATSAIRELEASSGRPSIPIVAMTAGAMRGDRERALSAGMNDYLAKPVLIQDLKRTVELWLKNTPIKPTQTSFAPPGSESITDWRTSA